VIQTDETNLLKVTTGNIGIVGNCSSYSLPQGAEHQTYLENGGTLEMAQCIAGHADSRTTKLYDPRRQKVLLEDIERIRYGVLGDPIDGVWYRVV